MKKKALIFGVTGQDGSYLAELLLEKGYEVHGMVRKSATGNTKNINHLINNQDIFNRTFFLERGDLSDATSLYRIINNVRPHEIYNEADQDHVGWSYDIVGYSGDITASAVARILEMIRQIDPKIKYFQPCSSNMFGQSDLQLQNEKTEFKPQSIYACGKIFAFHTVRFYRETFGIFASTAIFFNHESSRRTVDYVTRKITRAAASISLGKQEKLKLGDLSASIDWGYAREYMEAAWNIMQLEKPDDFVIGTGETHTVKEFLDEAFKIVNLKVEDYVEIDQSLLRPATNSILAADTSKAQKTFGFSPKYKFKELVKMMVEEDIKDLKNNY